MLKKTHSVHCSITIKGQQEVATGQTVLVSTLLFFPLQCQTRALDIDFVHRNVILDVSLFLQWCGEIAKSTLHHWGTNKEGKRDLKAVSASFSLSLHSQERLQYKAAGCARLSPPPSYEFLQLWCLTVGQVWSWGHFWGYFGAIPLLKRWFHPKPWNITIKKSRNP